MPFNIIRNDITRVSADAIVNTANPEVAIGAGVDSAIYEAAGEEELLAERAKIGPMTPGEAAVTPAFGLDAKYIIHTVGPVWLGGAHGEREAVASCYRRSLQLAAERDCGSIAFPLISTGTYGFPKDQALKIAVREISDFLSDHDMDVYLVVYDKESFVISGKAFSDIRSYIEEKDVLTRPHGSVPDYYPNTSKRRRIRDSRRRRQREAQPYIRREEAELSIYSSKLDREEDLLAADVSYSPELSLGGSLEDILEREAETFQEMLFRIIDRKGLKDPDVYKKANIDRKLFSKIRSSRDYAPSKRTVLALAVALELNLDETLDLLRRAGFALSPSSNFDLIVGYCIDKKIYNIFDINTYLFKYDQPLLGA